jgi:sulfopyruvate decarboxylase subunit beta
MPSVSRCLPLRENAGHGHPKLRYRQFSECFGRPAGFRLLAGGGLGMSVTRRFELLKKLVPFLQDELVIDGDGSVLMNLGTLSTIANFGPENYTLLIVDNR